MSLKGGILSSSYCIFFVKKNARLEKSVTLRNFDIFRWDFFKTISTRSENAISGLTSDISAVWREVSAIKVIKQHFSNLFLKKKHYFSVFWCFFCSEMYFFLKKTHLRNLKALFLRFSGNSESSGANFLVAQIRFSGHSVLMELDRRSPFNEHLFSSF